MTTTLPVRPSARLSATTAGALTGIPAMAFVGSSVAVSAHLADAPLSTVQSLRYALAALLLAAMARIAGHRVQRPRGAEWLWLGGVVATGLVLFNIGLVRGGQHAEPAVLGVAVACVPLVLAVVGPLLEGNRPRPRVLAAAAVVTAGAVLVQGAGQSDGLGIAWAVLVLGCEVGFTLLAVPLLRRHGPWGVSMHTAWLAALAFGAGGVVLDGPTAIAALGGEDLLAAGYLAVVVTAVAFVLWYSAVGRLGAARAGLLTGITPIAAALTAVALGGAAPRPLVLTGIAVVGAGLVLGLGAADRSAGAEGPWTPGRAPR